MKITPLTENSKDRDVGIKKQEATAKGQDAGTNDRERSGKENAGYAREQEPERRNDARHRDDLLASAVRHAGQEIGRGLREVAGAVSRLVALSPPPPPFNYHSMSSRSTYHRNSR